MKNTIVVLIITASHQTFSGQFWCLSGQNKFDLTHLLYIINGKVSVFLVDKVMSGQISTLIISTAIDNHLHHAVFTQVMVYPMNHIWKMSSLCSELSGTWFNL